MKVIDRRETQLQRFISVLSPTNEMMMDLPGAQDTLPYVGQLTALYLGPDEELFMESEDLQSAFNLFRVPPQWAPFFAYSRKVDGSAFGRPDLGNVRPVLMAVTLVRHVIFDLVKVPRSTSLEKGLPIPPGDSMDKEGREPTETHVRFNQVCDEVGLPRNATKRFHGGHVRWNSRREAEWAFGNHQSGQRQAPQLHLNQLGSAGATPHI